MAFMSLGRFCFILKFLPASCFPAKSATHIFVVEPSHCRAFVLQRVLFTQFSTNTIMPPKRKVEAKKVEKIGVKGNGDALEMQNNVKQKGRGKKADNAVNSDNVVEQTEIVTAVKVKKGQKKETIPSEEPMTRGRKLKNEKATSKELEPPPVPKVPSPIKRGRKPKAQDDEALAESVDEPPIKKVLKEKATSKQKEVVVPVAGMRTRKVATVKSNEEEQAEEEEDKKRAVKQPKEDAEKNTIQTNYENIDFSACQKNSRGEMATMKFATWNIGGIRAWLKKDGLQYIINESPDILCLQETKCSEKKLPEDFVSAITGGSGKYHMYCLDGEKYGYAGVAMLTRTKPLSVSYGIGHEDMDKESRCITAHFEKYYVLNVYVPNAGRGLVTLRKRLEWNDAFRAYVKLLNSEKPVIICGDMNVAHNEIDLKNPKSNKNSAGFSQEERDGMTAFLCDGFVDVYRHLYPEEKDCYTYWSYMNNSRNKNVGWRLDYFIASERFMENICDTKIRNSIYGSDHCPLTLYFNCDK